MPPRQSSPSSSDAISALQRAVRKLQARPIPTEGLLWRDEGTERGLASILNVVGGLANLEVTDGVATLTLTGSTDADTLDGLDSTAFALAGHSHAAYTPPTYAPGGVLFADGAGAPTVDVTNFAWDDAANTLKVLGRAGIGIAPESDGQLSILGSGSGVNVLKLRNADGFGTGVLMEEYVDGQGNMAWVGLRARGTKASPTSVSDGDFGIRFAAQGYAASGGGFMAGGAEIRIVADSPTASTAPMRIELWTGTGTGSAPTRKWYWNPAGHQLAATDGAYDIGASGGSRPRTIYAASQFNSAVATGTPPLVVASTTVVPNLNADMVDGQHASAFQSAIAAVSGSTDVVAGLVTQGLRAATSNPPLNLGTGAITAGNGTYSGDIVATNVYAKGRPVFDVRAYGTPSGVDDTTMIAAAITAAAAVGGIVYFPQGVYYTNQQIITSLVSFVGAGSHITRIRAVAGATGPLLKFNMSAPTSSVNISGFLLENIAGIAGIELTNCDAAVLSDLWINAGTVGIDVKGGCGESRFQNIRITACTTAGVRIDGDTTAELVFDTVAIANSSGTLASGIELIRTLTPDTGAYYFTNVKITNAGTLNRGFYFHSSTAETNAPCIFTGCVADNVNGTGNCWDFVNINGVQATNCFANGANYAVGFDNSDDNQWTNSLMHCASGGFIFTNGSDSHVLFGNRIERGVLYDMPASSPPTNLIEYGNRLGGTSTATDDWAKLAASAVTTMHSAMSVLTDSAGSTFQLWGVIDATTAPKKKHFRVNANGDLELLNEALSAIRYAFTDGGTLFLNESDNTKMSQGITVNQGANDNEILALKSSDVAHGVTDLTETDTFGYASKNSATEGGLLLRGLSEGQIGLNLGGIVTTTDATRSTAGVAAVILDGRLKSGTGVASLGADKNILVIRDNGTARFIFDSDGDSHQDVGTAWTNFDSYDDVALLDATAALLGPDTLRTGFAANLEAYRDILEAEQIVSFNDDGHHFINWSRFNMLHMGATRHVGSEVAELRAEVAELRALILSRS